MFAILAERYSNPELTCQQWQAKYDVMYRIHFKRQNKGIFK